MGSNDGRVKNVSLNIVYALIGQMVNILANFVLRTVFVETLSVEYLGLNGLFANILQFLALAELGIGTAITFSLYEPIARNDKNKIIALMRIYKYAYIAIGGVILLFGCIVAPFISFFIADVPDIPYIHEIFLLYVIDSASSYFFSYKAAFISANQKNYIVTNNTNLFLVIRCLLQGICLFAFRNYIAYMLVQIFCTICSNVCISIIANTKYPILTCKKAIKLEKRDKRLIIDNVKAIIWHRIGGIVVFSSSNILLSKMVGVAAVGLYSNYSLIISAIERITGQFFTAIAAGVGNLRVESDIEWQNKVFNISFFVQFLLFSFMTTFLFCIINPFINIWLGAEYYLDEPCVLFILINFYLKGMRQITMTFNTSYGFSPKYKYMPIPEIIINLFWSILLTEKLGMMGVFIGTTISTVLAPLWVEPFVLYKYGFYKSVWLYFKRYLLYAGITIGEVVVTYAIVRNLPWEGNVGFIWKCLFACIIPNGLNVLLFYKTEEFQYIWQKAKKIVQCRSVS